MSQLAQMAQVPAEASVVSCGLQCIEKVPDANLHPRNFLSGMLGALWGILIDVYTETRSITGTEQVITEAARRARVQGLAELDEVALYELVNISSTGENLTYYSEIVLEQWMAREARRVCDRAFESGQVGGALVDRLLTDLADVRPEKSGGYRSLSDLMDEVIANAEKDELPGVTTGFDDIDSLTGGLPKSVITILAARPSVGKSTLAQAMALESARRGVRVEFYTMEDSEDHVMGRMACRVSGLPGHLLRMGHVVPADVDRLREAKETIKDYPLIIRHCIPSSATQWAMEAKRNAIRHNTQAIFIDYVQLLSEPGCGTRNDEIATVSRRIKALALDTGAAVVLCSQFRRLHEKDRPALSDLRDSGALEQDAHMVFILNNDAESDTTKSLFVAKNKDGPTTGIHLRWNKRIPTFYNNSPQGDYHEQCSRSF